MMKDHFQTALVLGATDLHLEENGSAYARVLGELQPLADCSAEEYDMYLTDLLARHASSHTIVEKSIDDVKDFSCEDENGMRMRVRCYRSQGRRSMAVRFLPKEVPPMSSLKWPGAIQALCGRRQGMILVTGASGSGKSTTLAAMLMQIASTRACHIVTYENPVEYRLDNVKALIHQCEVSRDVGSFCQGAEDALRMDADVIMLGELTDLDTMRAALRLSESGHLVLATMHAASSAEAVAYFIEHFASEEQQLIRHQLAAQLDAVITQRLLRHSSQMKMIAAYEVLLNDQAVSHQIREGVLNQLDNSIESGRSTGMISLEESLAALVKAGSVTLGAALQAANHPERMKRLLER